MADTRVARPASRGGGFSKGLKAALDLLDRQPRIAVVAKSMVRAGFIRDLCVNLTRDPETVTTYLESPAADAFQSEEYNIVVLDASIDELTRATLKLLAKTKLASCKVIEIKKWSAEPPA